MSKTKAERLEAANMEIIKLRDNSLDANEHAAWQAVLEAMKVAAGAGQAAYERQQAQQAGRTMANAVLAPTRARTRG